MYLFCDIDGVLIPFPGDDGIIPPTHRLEHVQAAGYDQPVPIWLNPDHGPMLASLIQATGLEPVWCTSWRADASRLIGQRLGLPPWPHVNLPRLPLTDSHPDGYLWKRDHVARHARNQPLAWIDDDFADPDHRWTLSRTAAGSPTLLIQPNPHAGIQQRHIDQITNWVHSLSLPRTA
jgi:hypothetical protein